MTITITTNNSTSIIRNSATLNGSILGIASGEEYNCWFEYRPLYFDFEEMFEDWNSGDILPNWAIPSGTDYYKEEIIVTQGTYSLKVIPDGFTQVTRLLIADVVPYRGKVLWYAARVRSNVNSDANLGISVNEGELLYGNNSSTLNSWVLIEGEITIPSNATGPLNLNLYCGETPQSGGVSYYDDINIRILGTIIETSKQLISSDSSFASDITSLVSSQIYRLQAAVQNTVSGSSEEYGNTISFTAAFWAVFATDLRTKILKTYQYLTNLITNIRTIKKFSTKLYTKAITYNKFATDLRTKVQDYDLIQPGALNDFIVKLDGSELTDVDYSTLRITYNRNSTPSVTNFVLGRYHDKLNYKLDNTPSEITEENKIEIYDDTTKIFTGYITQINANSNTETVSITAEDCRYKMSKISMSLWYGGGYNIEEDDQNKKYEKNTVSAISEIMTKISSLISGYDTLTFGASFVPEYVDTYNDCASLLTELITNMANAGWYIDANERLKYYKVGEGTIKTLSLSSVDSRRHVYDVIVDNIVLNKKLDSYCQSYNVKLGKAIIKNYNNVFWIWIRDGFRTAFINNLKSKYEVNMYMYQSYGDHSAPGSDSFNGWFYVGENVSVSSTISQGASLYVAKRAQWLYKESETDLSDISVGSGEPTKTLYLTNYGTKIHSNYYTEMTSAEITTLPEDHIYTINDDRVYLVNMRGENYDRTAFAQEIANFELSRVNTLTTQATVTLLLDAYKYFNIGLDNRINLNNTLESNIYNNTNGFPLNINSVTINCANRIVTLNLTNYGQSAFAKSGNFIANYSPEVILSKALKYPVNILNLNYG